MSPPRGVRPVPPRPGQESVWDYPRPPRVDRSSAHVVIEFDGRVIADTRAALRVLETSHPPVFYVPRADIVDGVLEESPRSSYCEFKGESRYVHVSSGNRREIDAGWHYPSPRPAYRALVDHVAFYPGRMDRCLVDGEEVQPQVGGFYGGWVTSSVVGPFKGGPGTFGW
jgi:uncharacterized protein (DUF427 family)